MNEEMKRIIEVTNEVKQNQGTAGCTSEVIAAAFILNDMNKLPVGYTDVAYAWERLGSEWQGYVQQVKQDYRHLILSS